MARSRGPIRLFEVWLDDAKQLVYSLAEDGKALAKDLRQAVAATEW